jgi:predicted protein tyrosine phosphatase
LNILFVCSKNKWRSLTAEALFKNDQRHSIKSAGTENDARVKLNAKLIQWADLIFVMEKYHKELVHEKFTVELTGKKLVVLEIEDNYTYMDEELVAMLKISVEPYL